jgi:hypothetical protein
VLHSGKSLALPANRLETRLERLARDKRSSLLQKVVTYGRKKLHNMCHRSL